MKLRSLFITLGLSLTVGAAVAVGVGTNQNPKETIALSSCYARGSIHSIELNNDWSTGKAVGTLSGSEFQWLNVTIYTVDEFKFVVDGNTWLGYEKLEEGCKNLFSNGDNLTVAKSGIYDFYVKQNSIWVSKDSEIPDLVVNHVYTLKGDRDGWSGTFGTFNENNMTITATLNADESFKIVGDSAKYFGYDRLTSPGSYFQEGEDGNITARKSGTYVFTIPNDFYTGSSKVTFTATIGSGFIYVLDKYGNLLSSAHNAYAFTEGGIPASSWPGTSMSTYEGTYHMYSYEFYEGLRYIIFNNGTTQSWTYDLAGANSKAGKCLILDGSTTYNEGAKRNEWDDTTWVEPATAKFIENCLHFANSSESDEGTRKCISENWYTTAKSAYQKLSPQIQAEVCTLDYVVARLQAWARANHESFNLSAGVGSFSASRVTIGTQLNSDANGILTVIVIVSSIGVLTTAAYYFFKRSKKA